MTKTIIAIEDSTHKITVDSERTNLYLDGKLIGYEAYYDLENDSILRFKDDFSSGGDYSFSVFCMKTDDGKVHCVATRPCRYRHLNNYQRYGCLFDTLLKVGDQWHSYRSAREKFRVGMKYEEPREFNIKEWFAREHPDLLQQTRLQAQSSRPHVSPFPDWEIERHKEPEVAFYRDEEHRVLTNNRISIPFDRPKGWEWDSRRWSKIQFLKAIHWATWDLMLQVVEGKELCDIIKPKKLIAAIAEFKQQRKQQALEERRRIREQAQADKRLQAFLSGQCFNTDEAKSFYLGGKFLFSLEKNGRTAFIVDAPQYGVGLYVFTDETEARAWASGMIDFTTARDYAHAFIIHDPEGKWRNRVDEVLAELFSSNEELMAAD